MTQREKTPELYKAQMGFDTAAMHEQWKDRERLDRYKDGERLGGQYKPMSAEESLQKFFQDFREVGGIWYHK